MCQKCLFLRCIHPIGRQHCLYIHEKEREKVEKRIIQMLRERARRAGGGRSCKIFRSRGGPPLAPAIQNNDREYSRFALFSGFPRPYFRLFGNTLIHASFFLPCTGSFVTLRITVFRKENAYMCVYAGGCVIQSVRETGRTNWLCAKRRLGRFVVSMRSFCRY